MTDDDVVHAFIASRRRHDVSEPAA